MLQNICCRMPWPIQILRFPTLLNVVELLFYPLRLHATHQVLHAQRFVLVPSRIQFAQHDQSPKKTFIA